MYAALGLALYSELRKGILEHRFKILVEAAELPIVLDNDLEIVLVGDGVYIYVPDIVKNRLALMHTGERDRAAQTRLLGAAVEVDYTAVFGHLLGILFEILRNDIAESAARCVIHSAARSVARIGICPHDKERTAYGGNEGHKAHSEHEVHKCGRSKSLYCPTCAEIISGVDSRNGDRSAGEEEEAKRTEADLGEGSDEAELGLRIGVLRMTPVPAGVGMSGEDNGIVILAVLREQLAVGVLRYLLLKEHIDPCLIKENAAYEPNNNGYRHERHSVPDRGDTHCNIYKGAQRKADPAGIGDSADGRTRRDRKFFTNRLDAYLSELIAHIGRKFFLIVGTRQS